MPAQSAQSAAVPRDTLDLAQTVAEFLSAALGRPVRVETLTREPSPFVTLFPAEVLRASLDDGTELRLFLKHLGPEQSDQPDKQRRDREPRVYQCLLRDPKLPIPRYFGSRHNPASNCHEIFLEYIDDWCLRYHHIEHWITAAHRLAHLHAHFAQDAELLRSRDFLLHLDIPYLRAWADRAQSAVTAQSPPLAAKLHQILKNYTQACALLTNQPVTLVHNDLAPKNVLADRSANPARISIIDWELAGAGCGLLDLVHLTFGLDDAAERDMLTAYRSALSATGLLPRDDREFDRLLAACELHKTLYRLAHSPAWNLPLSTVEQWVTQAATFMTRVENPTSASRGNAP